MLVVEVRLLDDRLRDPLVEHELDEGDVDDRERDDAVRLGAEDRGEDDADEQGDPLLAPVHDVRPLDGSGRQPPPCDVLGCGAGRGRALVAPRTRLAGDVRSRLSAFPEPAHHALLTPSPGVDDDWGVPSMASRRACRPSAASTKNNSVTWTNEKASKVAIETA